MQTLHTARTQMRRSAARSGRVRPCRERGFTLVELMVVVAILAIMAAAAFAGIRQQEHKSQFERFVDDAHGALISARNIAIDNQTLVQVSVSDDEMLVTEYDPVTDVWGLVNRVALDAQGEAMLNDGSVCIHGLQSGVQTPAQAVAQAAPGSCSGGLQILQFEPDGTFSDPTDSFSTVENGGASLWIGDHDVAGDINYALIQIFPGGLIRMFDKVGDGA